MPKLSTTETPNTKVFGQVVVNKPLNHLSKIKLVNRIARLTRVAILFFLLKLNYSFYI
ncbi:hypothetical protein ACFP3I_15130 [Chryseobacterium arachidis]|uniref:hypothetical protein n=1 Tax=Chryseobacterium arachidis TaxID=1416778 RepID=UPI003621861B